MKRTALKLMTLLLAACGPSSPTDTVESLVADPERLRALQKQCRLDHEKIGDSLCRRVSEANTLRFLGNGTPYTPSKTVPKF